MSKPSKRKSVRRRKRDQKQTKRNRSYCRRQARIGRFPEFVFEGSAAPSALVDVVKTTLLDIAADHEVLFPRPLVELYQRARKEGFRSVLHVLRSHAGGSWIWTNLLTLPGQALFVRLPKDLCDRYFPFHNVRILAGNRKPNAFTVTFRWLREQKTGGGTAYYSPQEPRIELEKIRPVGAFYRHAIERICERTVGDWQTYLGLGDAFAYLHDCIYYEPWRNDDGPGFAIYEQCLEPFFTWDYAKAILGEAASSKKSYYYRLGYCPAVQTNDLLVAKTLLVPGMKGTPEYSWYLDNVGRSSHERHELHKRAAELTKSKLAETGDFSLLKQFHLGGISQVVEIEHEVFRHLV